MRARQINKASITIINHIQPNDHRKVITKLLKITKVATLKMLVMMQWQHHHDRNQAGEKKLVLQSRYTRTK